MFLDMVVQCLANELIRLISMQAVEVVTYLMCSQKHRTSGNRSATQRNFWEDRRQGSEICKPRLYGNPNNAAIQILTRPQVGQAALNTREVRIPVVKELSEQPPATVVVYGSVAESVHSILNAI